jgi:RNA polymerase sigma factor (sigma-70 family)
VILCQVETGFDHFYGDMSTPLSLPADSNDALLVERSRAGDDKAFSRIVARYQSSVCALAYSATGSRSRSEDLAQETFVTAWQNLSELREPSRLRAWLCGIARNVIHGDIRRLGRQPTHAADALDAAAPIASAEPLPTAQAGSNEEKAILWREVGRQPESYREPLVLFYREHKSVESVAAALELTPDAVMQRLSRGRRLLQERMLEFVETTLERTNPGQQFTAQVTAALPVLVGIGPGVAASTAGSGGAVAKGGLLGTLLGVVAPLVGVFAALGVSWIDIRSAQSSRERRFIVRWTLALWLCTAGFVVALPVVGRWSYRSGLRGRTDWLATAPMVAVWFGFAMLACTLIVLMLRGRATLRRQLFAENQPAAATPRSIGSRVLVVVGMLTAVFWAPLFLAWSAGDYAVAGAIGAVVLLLCVVAGWIGRHQHSVEDEEKSGGWFVALCGLVFLGILNWRLEVWLASMQGVDLATMHQLLPPALVHGLSAIAVGWIGTLVWLTRPLR